MSVLEILKDGLIGGTIESLLTYVSEQSNPLYSAVFWAFPSMIITSTILLLVSNTSTTKIIDLSRASFISSFKLTVFFTIFLYLAEGSYLKKNKYKVPIAYLIGCVGYIALAFLFLYLY